MPNVRVANFFGGFPIKQQIEQLKTNTPHAVVGTPGRLKQASVLMAYTNFVVSFFELVFSFGVFSFGICWVFVAW